MIFEPLSVLTLIIFLVQISTLQSRMHITLPKTLEVCAVAAGLAFLADAQEVAEGGIATIHGTDDKGPWSEPKSDFDTILQSPNATGQFDVPGFDIPTASNISGGWSWSGKCKSWRLVFIRFPGRAHVLDGRFVRRWTHLSARPSP